MGIPEPVHYNYRISWSVEDNEYVATIEEFPSLSWLASSPVEALKAIVEIVRDISVDGEI